MKFLSLPLVDGEASEPLLMSDKAIFSTLDFPFVKLDIYLLGPYGTPPVRCTILEQDGKQMIVGPNGILAERKNGDV